MAVDIAAFKHITERILGAAIEVHRTLGPGLLESVYGLSLQRELSLRGLRFVAQIAVPVIYKGVTLGPTHRIDLLIEGLVVVEVKSVAGLDAVHAAQTLTYMRLANCPVGLLINFNVPRLMDGVKRILNSSYSSPRPSATP